MEEGEEFEGNLSKGSEVCEAEFALRGGLADVARDAPSGDHGDLLPKSSNTDAAPSKSELSEVPVD